jgi:hypothetical protein
MDTDELSNEIYTAIIVEAEKFNHDLTLQFGLLSYNCKNEKDFIEKSKQLINEMKNADPNDLIDIFENEIVDLLKLNKTLDKILNNILKVENKL